MRQKRTRMMDSTLSAGQVRLIGSCLAAVLSVGPLTFAADSLAADDPSATEATRPLPSATDRICIRGVYPHLAMFNSTLKDDGQTTGGGGECGIGAVVPWAGRLWALTYSPHAPNGSSDKLYAIDDQLNQEIRPESIGGTPAGRMIHRESRQLFIGPYAIDADGRVRAIPYSAMPGRPTAVSRHLSDPANKVYYFDMEGRIYEVDVHSLEVTLLFAKPVPGWHGKGAYTGQGRYILANNGELDVAGHSLDDLQVGGPPQGPEDNGVLAEWDGQQWRIIERRQFTEVTGPGGIYGSPDESTPVWAVGWDRRSVILKLLDGGTWHTFRLPKASHTYDGYGGWYTEWPRIREIQPGKLMLDMHAMLWDFPATFSAANTGGIRPIASHHRYIPDFCHWNGRIVLATDETTIMANPLAGQSQSNLWFGQLEDMAGWGPKTAWGGPWVGDAVKAGEPSVPFQINGFQRRCVHLALGRGRTAAGLTDADSGEMLYRCTGLFPITALPEPLRDLARVTIGRGDYHDPAPGYSFVVNQDVVVYLEVDARPEAKLGPGWDKTPMSAAWGNYTDHIYRKSFPKGRVDVPGHPIAHKPNDYGVPHLAFVEPAATDAGELEITELPRDLKGRVTYPARGRETLASRPASPTASDTGATFTLEADIAGDGRWTRYRQIPVPADGYVYHVFPDDFQANWIRVTVDRDCLATAFFHYSSPGHAAANNPLFAALADVHDDRAVGGLIRPGKRNRNLQFLARRPADDGQIGETYFEVDERMAFSRPDADAADEVREIAEVHLDFEVDDASVIMTEKGRRFRLPKGDARYDRPFATGWPRGIRECESERWLMNIHGTFYEKPREAGLWKIKPVATHNRQIMDFCTWRGLLVISGTTHQARPDGQYFRSDAHDEPGLWFGAIDDLWQLGKPVGHGGPWLDTPVRPRDRSDPYLMNGYDRKRIAVSHDADAAVTVTIEVNFDHGDWREYDNLSVPPGQTVTHEFPQGFAAHWVRVSADQACRATAQLTYD